MDPSYDISLYGHLTHDLIVSDDFSQSNELGGMANVWKCLTSANPSLSINLQPVCIGSALIFVNKISSSRISKPNMNQFVNKKINLSTNSKWSHVLYLNQLPELPFIKKLSGISEVVSADISSGGSIPYEYLKYIDFLFISEEDLKISFSDLCKQTKGWVILHYPSGSSSSNGKETVKVSNEVVKNLNVLGAGDIFCSNFINEMLLSNNIKKSLKYSHNATSNFLKLKNEQKI